MVIELESQFKKRKSIIEEILKRKLDQYDIQMTQLSFDNLVIHLSLCVSRELNGSYILTSESQMNSLKQHDYYKAAKDIIQTLSEEFSIEIDENQICYSTMYLANLNLLDLDFHCEFDLFDDDLENIINETLSAIKEQLNFDLKKNDKFYNGMTLHFFPALDRLQNDVQLTDNPLKDLIQAQHQNEFACAKIFNEVVKKYYNKSFNEHELAYIALHFGTAFNQ